MSASAANVSGSTPVRTVEVNEVWASSIKAPTFRLDAAHYRNQFAEAATRALSTGLPVRKVRDMADAFVPGRTKLITVKSAEAGAPYLRAHDAFEIRVNSDRRALPQKRDDPNAVIREKSRPDGLRGLVPESVRYDRRHADRSEF